MITFYTLIAVSGLSLIIGSLIAWSWQARRMEKLKNDHRELSLRLALERESNQQLDQALEQSRLKLTEAFQKLSHEALERNNLQFLKLAEQNMQRHQSDANSALLSREKAIEQLIKPINDALTKTREQIQQVEKDRQQSYGELNSTIKHIQIGQQTLQQETHNLVQALRRPEVRGQWGEMTLKRLAELSGMVARCDFFEQTQRHTESGTIRPDMIIRLPESREIIVDAKTPLDAYLSAIEAGDDNAKAEHLRRHAKTIRQRIKDLSAKNYWAEYSQSPEFVVLFIPGEHFLSAALDYDHTLQEDSMQANIILATPNNFIAILRTVSYGWKQQALAENAVAVRDLGETLYKRLTVFTEHLTKLGNSLNSSVDNFNKSVGSLERQILPAGRRFLDMGIRAKKQFNTPEQIDKALRTPSPQGEQQVED